jgi:hypothetical protein
MAPEYIFESVASVKAYIYNLGVIISEIWSRIFGGKQS